MSNKNDFISKLEKLEIKKKELLDKRKKEVIKIVDKNDILSLPDHIIKASLEFAKAANNDKNILDILKPYIKKKK